MDEVAVSADGLTRRGQATDPSYSELLAGVREVEFRAKKGGAWRLCSSSRKSRTQFRRFLNFSTTQQLNPAAAGNSKPLPLLAPSSRLLAPCSVLRARNARPRAFSFF